MVEFSGLPLSSEQEEPKKEQKTGKGSVRRGIESLRRKLQRPQKEGIPQRGFIYTPAPEFLSEQQEIVDKHTDEEKPRDTGPYAFAIVTRAYKELSNGNLTERLRNLANLEVPESQVKAYISVNNPRIWAISSDIIAQHQQEFDALDASERRGFLQQQVSQRYESLGMTMSTYESSQFAEDKKWEAIIEKVGAFQENRATLQILEEITTTVNKVSENGADKDALIHEALERIEATGRAYLTEPQRQSLVSAAKLAMNKDVAIMGVDCSSSTKAYDQPNLLGTVTYEAAQIALSQGAQFIDIADMDNYYSRDSLTELYNLARKERIDVFSRPMLVVPSEHPEQLSGPDHIWSDLMQYYSNTYTYALPGYWRDSMTTGAIIVSADTFRKHPYPHAQEQLNEDYDWFDMLKPDDDLKRRYAVSSILLRAQRDRPESVDGATFFNRKSITGETPEEIRPELQKEQYKKVERYIRDDRRLEDIFDHIEKYKDYILEDIEKKTIPDFKAEYEKMRSKLFHSNQKRRETNRRIFLGKGQDDQIDEEGTLAQLYAVYLEDPHVTPTEIIERATIPQKRRVFFDQNPQIIPGVMQEIQRITAETGVMPSLNDVVSYIEITLPELFAPPLSEEPEYTVDNIDASRVNITDWMHLYQAQDLFSRWITNLELSGEFSKSDMSRVLLSSYSF